VRDGGCGFVVVVDERGDVLGCVTDVELRHSDLSADPAASIGALASGQFAAVTPRTPDVDVARLLASRRLSAVPVIEERRFVGIRTLGELGMARPRVRDAVLMVGGRGERLRPLTDTVPKPLLRVEGTPIIERIITDLSRAGIELVWLAVNYLAEHFERRLGDGGRLGVEIRFLRETEPMGTAGALSLMPSVGRDPVLVMNGDLVTSVDYAALADYHWHHGAAATVAAVRHSALSPYGILETSGHDLVCWREKPRRVELIAAGIYVLDPAVIQSAVPGQGMNELVDSAIVRKERVVVFPIVEEWHDIGTGQDLENLQERINRSEG
jgi:NDP-sugar pyrophosphorylase family protein